MNTFYIFLAQSKKLNNNSGKNYYFLFLDCNNHCTIYICITFTFCLLIIYSGKENNKQQAVNMDKSK